MKRKRNVKEIKIWMIRNDVREIDIIKATGQEPTYVNKTINGTRDNRVVLRWLLEKGCPQRYLGLPDDMLDAA
ncbi:MAG: hypothetical protein WC952_14400 [Desulfobulbaceae bacterium]